MAGSCCSFFIAAFWSSIYCEFSGLMTGPGPNTSGGRVGADVSGLSTESAGISAATALNPNSDATTTAADN